MGLLSPALLTSNPNAQSLTLKVTDFAFPSALASARALLSAGSGVLGSTSAGNVFAHPGRAAGPLQVWTYGAAGTDAGTFEVDLTSASGAESTSAYGVNNGNSQAFAYVTPTALAAGAYQAVATDFGVPSLLQTLKFAVAQNDQIVAQSGTAGTLPFTASAGPAVLLVNASPVVNGDGLFDVNVQTAAASPALVFDRTQGASLSGLFDVQTVNIGTSGSYDATLTDLKFPAQLDNLALVVSSGSTLYGKIFGGGTIPSFSASPGTLQLTFVATPAAQQLYGMYGVDVANSAPTVTLSATPTTVTAGGTTTLKLDHHQCYFLHRVRRHVGRQPIHGFRHHRIGSDRHHHFYVDLHWTRRKRNRNRDGDDHRCNRLIARRRWDRCPAAQPAHDHSWIAHRHPSPKCMTFDIRCNERLDRP